MTTNQLITKIGRQRVLTALSNVVCTSSGGSFGTLTGSPSDNSALAAALAAKQATLVSGTNIKTVNGTSILGAGDLVIGGGTWGGIGGTITDQTDLVAYIASFSLTISTGLTNTAGNLTANLSTGVSGGQSVIGGTASGNDLTLSTTSHATKGRLILGNFQFSEANHTFTLPLSTQGSTISGAWTGTGTPQSHIEIAPTITGRTNAAGGGSDIYAALKINPTFVLGTGAGSQKHRGLEITGSWPTSSLQEALFINPTFSGASVNSYLFRIQANGTHRFYMLYDGETNASGTIGTFAYSTRIQLSTPLVRVQASGITDILFIDSGTARSMRLRWTSSDAFTFNDGTTDILTINTTNRLLVAAGSATIAQMRLTGGTHMTTASAGVLEYTGSELEFTRTGTTREQFMFSQAVNSVSPTAPNRTITTVIGGTTYYIAAKTTND